MLGIPSPPSRSQAHKNPHRPSEGPVQRGEKVPVDCCVLGGECAADEALLSGESALVAKGPGSRLVGGTVAYEGAVTARATATGARSTLAGGAG
ncbi:putative copper-exporting P-type ATPase V, partial [Tetrabaena socialis]